MYVLEFHKKLQLREKQMGKLYAKKIEEDSKSPKEVIVATSSDETKKKPVSEKRLLALEKAREKRQQKKLEVEKVKNAEKEKEEALLEKKRLASEKRKQTRLAKKSLQEPTPSIASEPIIEKEKGSEAPINEEAAPKKTRKRKPQPAEDDVQVESQAQVEKTVKQPKQKRSKPDINAPPKWFTVFMEGAKKEQAIQSGEKKSRADMKAEVQEHATKAWNDGYTRDRIQSEQDKHLVRMYSMMFSGRKL